MNLGNDDEGPFYKLICETAEGVCQQDGERAVWKWRMPWKKELTIRSWWSCVVAARRHLGAWRKKAVPRCRQLPAARLALWFMMSLSPHPTSARLDPVVISSFNSFQTNPTSHAKQNNGFVRVLLSWRFNWTRGVIRWRGDHVLQNETWLVLPGVRPDWNLSVIRLHTCKSDAQVVFVISAPMT